MEQATELPSGSWIISFEGSCQSKLKWIKKYRIYKDNLVKDFKQSEKEKINLFFKEVNPIIQKFMDKNSIDILLDRKNVFMGKKNSDITNQIIQELNKNSN